MGKKKRTKPFVGVFYSLAAATILVVGALLSINTHAINAYGPIVFEVGVGFIVLAVILLGTALCAVVGSRGHNKFCILNFVLFSILLFVVQLVLGTALRGTIIALPLSELEIKECLQPISDNSVGTKCGDFMRSEAVVKLFLMWEAMHQVAIKASGGESMKTLMMTIQSGGEELGDSGDVQLPLCCGFSPPQQCGVYGTDNSTAAVLFDDIGKDAEYHVADCGVKAQWFPSTDFCSMSARVGGRVVKKAGCPYHLPAGGCGKSDVQDYSNGCALNALVWIRGSVLPLVDIVLVIAVVQVIGALLGTCLCLKRKDHDVLPTKYTLGQD